MAAGSWQKEKKKQGMETGCWEERTGYSVGNCFRILTSIML